MDDAALLDLAVDKAAEAQTLARRAQLVSGMKRSGSRGHSGAFRLAMDATDLEVYARDRAQAISDVGAREAAMLRVERATAAVDRALEYVQAPSRTRELRLGGLVRRRR